MLGKTPPLNVPQDLISDFTMNGKVELKKWYLNNYYLSIFPRIISKKQISELLGKVKKKNEVNYVSTDRFLYQALEKYTLKDNSVAVMGSTVPFYEAVALYYGAKRVTVIEYSKIISFHPKIRTLTIAQYERYPLQFDTAFSISSFEHDGLGRYGDPLNPTGDLEAMERMKIILKPRGLLFLAVPIGKDAIFWNAHRVYGKHRLPLLFYGWQLVDSFGYSEDQLEKVYYKGEEHSQPIFVLQNH